jgi:hypothetical protein
MTCRHSDPINNPDCGSYRHPTQQLEQLQKTSDGIRQKFGIADGPDNSRFELLDVTVVGPRTVVRVRYESCPNCSFEGVKLLVYQNVSMIDVARWRVIDPHFTDEKSISRTHAPSPIARFPATEQGLKLAMLLAEGM